MEGYRNGVPDVGWWIGQIHQGIKYRKEMAQEARWNTWRKYYRGRWNASVLPKNIFFMMIRTVVPRIYFRDPSISLIPTKGGSENIAMTQILERVDNKLLRTMGVKRQMKRIVQNAFMFGTGIGKLGFGAEFTPTPDIDITAAPIVKRRRIEYRAKISQNMPWFLSVHPGSFIVPDKLVTKDEAAWEAHWVKRPIDDVREDPRLKHVTGLTATMLKDPQPGTARQYTKREMIDLVEIRDKRTGKIIVIAPYLEGEKALLFQDDEFQTDSGTNTYAVSFNEDDECFWGIPDSVILEPRQLEINEIKTQMMKHRRLSLIKVLYEKGSITHMQMTKLLDDDVGAGIEVTDINGVKFAEVADIPDGLLKSEVALMQDVREEMGFSRNEFGDYKPGSGDTTATEAQIVKMASEIRVDERRDMLADLLTDVVSDMHSVITSRWTEEQQIEIIGPAGVPLWVEFKGNQMRGSKFDVRIDPDSSLPDTKAMREQRAIKMYTILKENPLIDPMRLTTYLLHESYGVQFDDMIRGLPSGVGTAIRPLKLEEYMQVLQAVQSKLGQIPQQSQAQEPARAQQTGGANASV